MAKRKEAIQHESSDITYEDLKAIERTTARTPKRPKSLPLNQIRVADKVFQPRMLEGLMQDSFYHTHELMGELRTHGTPLTRIVVTPIGDQFYLVDGHHRLAAYRTSGWKKQVPVEVFDGPLKEALLESGSLNRRNTLNMIATSKHEFAWRLIKLREYDVKQIVQASGSSRRLVYYMRSKRDEMGDAQVSEKSWYEVLKDQQAAQPRDPDFDYEAVKSKELAESILRSTNINLGQNTDILLSALEILDQDFLRKVIHARYYSLKEILEDIRAADPELDALDI